jgi:hypothetical protein
VQATGAAGDAGGGVQQPVAEFLRLCGGQLAAQRKSLGPGEQVDGGEGQLQPCGIDGEVPGGEPAESGGLAAADAVLDAGVRAVADLQQLQGALAVGGVG